jgi:8-oxo-dGTP pyrophosphatase MutT (NUDIX family)
MTRWRVHGEAPLYTSDWLSLRLADVELPGGKRFSHHVVRMSFLVAGVVIRDPGRGVLLLHRHRFVTDTWGWEIPAGRVEEGETPEEAVAREAIEECGWRPIGVEALGFSQPSNGQIDQTFLYFAAQSAEYVREPEPDETERVAWFDPEEVRDLIRTGKIPDGLSVTALAIAFALGRL